MVWIILMTARSELILDPVGAWAKPAVVLALGMLTQGAIYGKTRAEKRYADDLKHSLLDLACPSFSAHRTPPEALQAISAQYAELTSVASHLAKQLMEGNDRVVILREARARLYPGLRPADLQELKTAPATLALRTLAFLRRRSGKRPPSPRSLERIIGLARTLQAVSEEQQNFMRFCSGHELPPPLRELLAAPVPHSPAPSTTP